jgi:hypothetical protein
VCFAIEDIRTLRGIHRQVLYILLPEPGIAGVLGALPSPSPFRTWLHLRASRFQRGLATGQPPPEGDRGRRRGGRRAEDLRVGAKQENSLALAPSAE